ncbi:MAG TPA: hypothetical protein DCY12_11845 [Candidatus Atribacteria bacterium]|nr:hypothetical protein [Candidatus Atribacteria bacterium]
MAKKIKKNGKKEIKKIIKKLNLSDYEYIADDENITLSAMAPQLVDFLNAPGIKKLFEQEVNIDKRKSLYSPGCLSELLILQNIPGYDRIESSRTLSLDDHYQEKLGINGYPDPETFRDELQRYTPENIDQRFIVNKKLLELLAKQEGPQYVDLHMDSRVITVYGDQENAEVGYNPQKPGRKSYHLKICTVEPFGFTLAIRVESGDAVSGSEFESFYHHCVEAIPTKHFVIKTIRLDRGFFSEDNSKLFEADYIFFEAVAKKHKSLKEFIRSIPEKDFEPFNLSETIEGALFRFSLDSREGERDFVAVRKLIRKEDNGQLLLFDDLYTWRYQVICHNNLDMSPYELWQDYNQRARIELVVKELDYDYFLTKVPTGGIWLTSPIFGMQLLPTIQCSFSRGIFYKVNGQPKPLLPCERNCLTFPEDWSTVPAEWLCE